MIGQSITSFWLLCLWNLIAVFQDINGCLSVGDFSGSWRAVPLSTYFLRWLGQFGILPWLVLWNSHLLSPSSTQVSDITLLQNVSSGNSWFCLGLLSCFPWFFVSLWLLRFPVAVLPKFCSWKIAFFSFDGWNCFKPFFSGRFYLIRGKLFI